LDLTRFIAYVGVGDRRIFLREYVGSKPQTVIRILCQIQGEVNVGSSSRNQVGVIKRNTVFGKQLMGQIQELLLISDVLQRDSILGIQRNIYAVPSLMKEILRNQNHADISLMAASSKQVTQLLRIKVIQQII